MATDSRDGRSEGGLGGFLRRHLGLDGGDRRARQELQRQLEISESRYRTLFESATDVLIGMDVDGRITFASPSAQTLFHRPADELVGTALTSLLHANDAVLFEQWVDNLSSRVGRAPKFRITDVDGRTQHVECTARALPAGGGLGVAMLSLRDVTERQALQRRLREAERLASVGTLAAGVAHECNNPLTYVLGNLDLVKRRLKMLAAEGVEVADMLPAAREAIDGALRVQRIVGDLKAFAGADDDLLRPLDLRDVLRSACKLAANQLRSRARVRARLEEVSAVRANEGRLVQVFVNLMVNAANALPEGRAGEHEVRVDLSAGDQGSPTVIVSDNGCGMTPEVLERIFEPFFTTRRGRGGTGLGMSICHGIVTGLGGDIHVDSEVGKGTRVQIRLPACKEPAASAGRSRSVISRGLMIRGKARVLVVDDEAYICALFRRTLAGRPGTDRKGHEVVTASGGREALDLLEAGRTFDFVFCDLVMPEVTGMDLYRTLIERHDAHADRMIVMTGGAFTPDARAFLDQVDLPVLEKPFRPREVRELIGALTDDPSDLDAFSELDTAA